MNEKSKAKMLEQKKKIVEGLKMNFPNLPLFEDEIAEDEEKVFIDSKYHLAILIMGDFSPSSNSAAILTQAFSVEYYSEDRDDVDEFLLDIITIIDAVPTVSFRRTRKVRMKVANMDRYVDVVTIDFTRSVKYAC
ncbi:hypothetical protein [Cytobacillus oceanisediminis]|uniref:hypothetical protein n=1 Tax=Cytobacillus oceanisediminis TaxID=665099 RepID=UPI001FB21A31|nr:hypothetical protein [Cytobacillus oceanisediminis]UOE54920.1 hypothetical protein IRB79_24580 [Cytobacillus oceanisediminis]